MFAPIEWARSVVHGITWIGLAQDLARLTLVSGAGVAALALLPRASAAVRHRIAIAALATCVALPLAATWLPSRPLPVLPARTESVAPMAPAAETGDAAETSVALAADATPSRDGVATASNRPAAATKASALGTVRVALTAAATTAASPMPASGVLGPVTGRLVSAVTDLPRPALVVLAWLAVSLLLFTRTIASTIAAHRLAARATEVTDERALRAFEVARRSLSFRGPVTLRRSADVSVPVVCGMVRPTLVMPEDAVEWSDARLRAVLTHELAHVARHDAASLLVTRVATTLFGFHPAVAALARHAWLACEQACDDVVLAHGARATAYAEDLLVIARHARERAGVLGVAPAFVRRSALERRLASILEPDVRREPASRRATLAIGAVAALAVALLGPVRLVSARAEAPPTDARTGTDPATVLLPRAELEESAAEGATAGSTRTSTAVEATIGSATGGSGVGHRRGDAEGDAAIDASSEPVAFRAVDAEVAANASGKDWFSRGRDFYQSEEWGDAAMAYLRAGAAGYRPGTAYYNAACSFALDGQTEAAIEALESALDAGFDRPDLVASDDDLDSIRSHARFPRLLNRARSTDRAAAEKAAAVHEYEALRASRSEESARWRSVGVDLMRSGETSRAVDAFATEFAIDSSASTLYNMACAYSLGGNRRAALDLLERAILAGYGGVDHMKKDADLAALRGDARFQRLVDLAKDLELEMSFMGGRGTWRRTLSRYEGVTDEYPRIGRAWFNLGFARLRAGDAAGSVEANRRALALGYRPGTTMYNIACGYAAQDRVDDAFAWLDRAEAAGMKVGATAESDDDLDALRSDARFRRYVERARAERRAERLAKVKKNED